MNKGLIDEGILRQSHQNFRKIVINLKNIYKKISSDNYSIHQFKENKDKINNIVKAYENSRDSLLEKLESLGDDENSDEIGIIKYGLEKDRNEVDSMVEEIKEKLTQIKTDMNLEMEDNNQEYNNELSQDQTQIITENLVNNQEILKKRGEELKHIHRTAGIIKDTTDFMLEKTKEQGEMLNVISDKVDKTDENVTEAAKQIDKADVYSKGNNKRMSCYIAIIVMSIGLILTIVISIACN
jgi:hypothetical protein